MRRIVCRYVVSVLLGSSCVSASEAPAAGVSAGENLNPSRLANVPSRSVSIKEINSMVDFLEKNSGRKMQEIREVYQYFSPEMLMLPQGKEMPDRMNTQIFPYFYNMIVLFGDTCRKACEQVSPLGGEDDTTLQGYREYGRYEAFYTFQVCINSFVRWLQKKDQFDQVVYTYRNGSQGYTYAKTQLSGLEPSGLIYFAQDKNGWLPLALPYQEYQSAVMMRYYYGYSVSGWFDRGVVVRSGGLKIEDRSGLYCSIHKLPLDTNYIKIKKYSGVQSNDPLNTPIITDVLDMLIPLNQPQKELNQKDFNSQIVSILNETCKSLLKGQDNKKAAFLSFQDPEVGRILACFVQYLSLFPVEEISLGEGGGSTMDRLLETLAEYCQEACAPDDALESVLPKKKRKKKKKNKVSSVGLDLEAETSGVLKDNVDGETREHPRSGASDVAEDERA